VLLLLPNNNDLHSSGLRFPASRFLRFQRLDAGLAGLYFSILSVDEALLIDMVL